MGKTNGKSSHQLERTSKPKSTKNRRGEYHKAIKKIVPSSQEKQRHSYRMKMLNKEVLNVKQSEKLRQERIKAQKEYKKKRSEKAKVISKKTRRGQPLMNDRMNLILKEIEKRFQGKY